jgi:hypothetical protein
MPIMSITAERCACLVLGLVAFAARLLLDGPVRLRTSTMDESDRWLLLLGSLIVLMGVPVVIFYLVLRGFGGLRPPARFVRRAGQLAAPSSGANGSAPVIILMGTSAIVIQPTLTFEGDTPQLAYSVTWPLVLVVLALWAVAVAVLFVPRPRLVLDAGGVTLQRVLRTVRLSWDDLRPGGPLPPKGRRPRELTLELTGEPMFGSYTPTESLPLYQLHIDPTYLADTIRYYVDHPEARATIGGDDPPAAPLAEPARATLDS